MAKPRKQLTASSTLARHRVGSNLVAAMCLMPPGWTLTVVVDRDGYAVGLTDPDGDDVVFPVDSDTLDAEIEAAVDYTIKCYEGRKHGK